MYPLSLFQVDVTCPAQRVEGLSPKKAPNDLWKMPYLGEWQAKYRHGVEEVYILRSRWEKALI